MSAPGLQQAPWHGAPNTSAGRPPTQVAPISPLGWKIKFVCASIVMFAAYAGITTVLDGTGWRAPRVVEARHPDALRDCDQENTNVETRAACIVARDNAREAERKARREKEAAETAKRRLEEKALDDEVSRQRDPAKLDEFEKQIDVLTIGEKRFATNTEKNEFLENATRALVRFLAAHEAPAVRAKIQYMSPRDAVNALNSLATRRSEPSAREQVDKTCNARTVPDWRAACGKLLKRDVLKLSPGSGKCSSFKMQIVRDRSGSCIFWGRILAQCQVLIGLRFSAGLAASP